jgi:hypothetical protein
VIHFIFLIVFAFFVSIAFGALANGTSRQRVVYGAKTFAQFVIISLVLAWVLYFIPW